MAVNRTIGPSIAPLGETESDYFGNNIAELAGITKKSKVKAAITPRKKQVKLATPFAANTPINAPLMQKMIGNEPGGPTTSAANGNIIGMDDAAWKKLLAKFGVFD